jgi:hypothetical protein
LLVTIPAVLKQIGKYWVRLLITISAVLKQIGEVLGNFFIQFVTIRAALKQIGKYWVLQVE